MVPYWALAPDHSFEKPPVIVACEYACLWKLGPGVSFRCFSLSARIDFAHLGEKQKHMHCNGIGGSEKERKGGRNAALVSSCDVCLSPGSRSPGCCQSNQTTTRNG